MSKRMVQAAVVALLAVLSPGCPGGPLSVYVRGVKPMNENDRKESTTVDIRIYQLKDDSRFNQATVDKLWTDDKGALADDLVAVKQETVYPGAADDKEKTITLGEMPDSVRFIGVLALFPKEDDKGPRKIVLPRAQADTVLRFTGFHIAAEK